MGMEDKLGEQDSVCFADTALHGSTAPGLSMCLSWLFSFWASSGAFFLGGGIPLPLLANAHTNLSIFLHYILLRGQDFCCHPSPYSGNPGLRLFAQSACRHLDCRTALSAQGRVGAGSYLLRGPGDGVPLVTDLSCCLGIQVSPLFPQCRHLCGASLCTPSPSLTSISFINIQPIFSVS